MRRTRGTLWLLVPACAVLAATLPAAAVADTPAGVAVSYVDLPSTMVDQVAPLAGDATHLVFAETQILGDGATGRSELELSDGSGAPADLGPFAPIASGYARPFSLRGNMLTATDSASPGFQHITWWNLTNGTTGTSDQIPGTWIGSAPDGWYYSQGDALYDESTSGSASLVATVFSKPSETITGGDVGPGGVILAGSAGQVAYVDAGSSVTLLATTWTSGGSPYDFVACRGTDDVATLCVLYSDDGESSVPVAAEQLPLDGSDSFAAPSQCFGTVSALPSAAFVGSTLVCAKGTVASQASDGSVKTSTYSVGPGEGDGGPQVVAALGKAVVSSPSLNQLETIVDAAHAPTLLRDAQESEVTSGSFALSPGQILWTTDASFGGIAAPGASEAIRTPLAWRGGALTPDGTGVIGPSGWRYVFASGQTVAYSRQVTTGGVKTWTVVVVSPEHVSTMTKVQRATVSLSGNRMLYRTTKSTMYRHGRYMLLDVTTGQRSPVVVLNAALARNINLAPSDIWGPYVAYVDGTEVYRLNVSTGKRAKVSAYRGNTDPSEGTPVTAYGPYVGWSEGDANLTGGTGEGMFRNVSTGAPPITLPVGTFIQAMTNSGIVTGSAPEHNFDNGVFAPNTYSVRGYQASATSAQVLDAPDSASRAQVDDGVVAWIDANHVVRVAAIDTGPVTPLSLGAPYAPASVHPPHAWHIKALFSATLAACKVTVTYAGNEVGAAPCKASAMALGVAQATFYFGKLGHYRWHVDVKGTSGVVTTTSGSFVVR